LTSQQTKLGFAGITFLRRETMTKLTRRATIIASLAATSLPLTACSGGDADMAFDPDDGFNESGIDWKHYETGLAMAQKENKPIFYLAHALWCPYCTNYRKNFFDGQVVKLLNDFVPVLVDVDAHAEVDNLYAGETGDYIPRTFFLNSQGKLAANLQGGPSAYPYFVDYDTPRPLRNILNKARQHFGIA